MNIAIWIIVFIVALILSVGFLMLVLTLVPAINQLNSLLKDLEKTSMEVRGLAGQLKSASSKVEQDIEKFDVVMDTTKDTLVTVKESLKFINTNVLKQYAGLWAMVPAIRIGWNFIKKHKRR